MKTLIITFIILMTSNLALAGGSVSDNNIQSFQNNIEMSVNMNMDCCQSTAMSSNCAGCMLKLNPILINKLDDIIQITSVNFADNYLSFVPNTPTLPLSILKNLNLYPQI